MYENYVRLRDGKGVTDYEVAKNTGVSTSTLTCWKQGLYVPKIEKLLKLADYFGVTLDDLVRNGERDGTS